MKIKITNKIVDLKLFISIIALNVNILNTSIKSRDYQKGYNSKIQKCTAYKRSVLNIMTKNRK